MLYIFDSGLTNTRPYCDHAHSTDTCTGCPQNAHCSKGRVVSCTEDYELHRGFCIHHQADKNQTLVQVEAAVLRLAEQKGKLTCEDSVFYPSASRNGMKDYLANFRTGERFNLNRDQALTILMSHPSIEYDAEYEYRSRSTIYSRECFTAMFLHGYKVPVIVITFLMAALAGLVYHFNRKVSSREQAQKMYSFLETEVKNTRGPISEPSLQNKLLVMFDKSFPEVNNLWPEILVHAEGNRTLKHVTMDQGGYKVRCWVSG